MVDLDIYRQTHKANLLRLVKRGGMDKAEFNASFYAATEGCKILACYFFLAEELGYDTIIDPGQQKTILYKIERVIRAYGYDEIRGVLPGAPEHLNSLAKIIYKK